MAELPWEKFAGTMLDRQIVDEFRLSFFASFGNIQHTKLDLTEERDVELPHGFRRCKEWQNDPQGKLTVELSRVDGKSGFRTFRDLVKHASKAGEGCGSLAMAALRRLGSYDYYVQGVRLVFTSAIVRDYWRQKGVLVLRRYGDGVWLPHAELLNTPLIKFPAVIWVRQSPKASKS